MYKIFIDGQNGTTGLQIQQRLALHDAVSLIELSDAERKNVDAKRAALADSDLSILCLLHLHIVNRKDSYMLLFCVDQL